MKTILIEIQIRDLIGLKPLINQIYESAIKGVEIGRGVHGDASFVYKMSYHDRGNFKEKNTFFRILQDCSGSRGWAPLP